MSEINDLSNSYVADNARLSPMLATALGMLGEQDSFDDLSPAGLADMQALRSAARDAIRAADSTGPDDEIARDVICERLDVQSDLVESGWAHADLNVIDSPLQRVRMVFDVMPTETDDDVAVLARRMAAVPAALDGYRLSLLHAASDGKVAARRQIDKCAEQCDTYAGRSGQGFFRHLVDTVNTESSRGPALTADLVTSATKAEAAYGELGRFLRDELGPRAPEKDAVGRERYVLGSRDFLGATVDLEETYAWGWAEFGKIEAEMVEVAERIAPGAGPAGAAAVLDADKEHQVVGLAALQAWVQQMTDRAIAELGGTYFEIPAVVRTVECLIAPPGGGVGAYYLGPSADFSRPGRVWWAVEPGREVFSTWRETSTVYHEGVPGHHLQIGTAVFRKDTLNDFQRLLAEISGHCEGWALYAEQLVRDLGYIANDGQLLGLLDSQLFRAARVIVDIGMHLELKIPVGTGFHEGERWTPELGLEFLLTRTLTDAAHCRDEIDRYLGWPGQAPSYKIGERVWIAGRDAARRRHGEAFDFKAFHSAALNMGGMGLDTLASRLQKL